MNTRARAIKSQAAAGRHDCTTVPGICTSDTTTVVTNTKEERHKEKPATVQSDTCSVSTNEKASEPRKNSGSPPVLADVRLPATQGGLSKFAGSIVCGCLPAHFFGQPLKSNIPSRLGKVQKSIAFFLSTYTPSPPSSHIRFCPCIVGSFDGCYPLWRPPSQWSQPMC